MWLKQREGEGKAREWRQLHGAGIIKDFLLFPKCKGEPLSGYKQMKDLVRFVTWADYTGCFVENLVGVGGGQTWDGETS